jgi:hypothetical protein
LPRQNIFAAHLLDSFNRVQKGIITKQTKALKILTNKQYERTIIVCRNIHNIIYRLRPKQERD